MSGYDQMEIKGNGKFLKIESGKPVDIHILNKEPNKAVSHWINKKKSTCIGEGCAECMDGDMPRHRWMTNVWDRKDKKVKLFEFGPSIAKQIKSIAVMLDEDGQTIHDIDLRISAEGEALEKRYTVIHRAFKEPIPDDVVLWVLK